MQIKMNSFKIIQDSREFFDLKLRLRLELEEFEKKVYSENESLNKIYGTLYELKSFVRKTESHYFQIKVNNLENLLNSLITKRKYKKIEFDRVFKTLEKIKETESSEFLNQAINYRIEKISEKFIPKTPKLLVDKNSNKFYRFNYKGLDYLVKAYPKKFILGADASKKFLRIGEEKFLIFPMFNFTEEENFQSCNILILILQNTFKCFRYNSFEEIYDIPYLNFEKKLTSLDLSTTEINSYLRYKGKRHYYINL